MKNENGFNLSNIITNKDISLVFTPSSTAYSFEYTVYKDGNIYLVGSDLKSEVNFNFTSSGTYNVEVIVLDKTGYSTYTSQYIVDKEKPVITLEKNSIVIEKGSVLNLNSNITVVDNHDGNITKEVTNNSSSLDLNILGEKKLTYSVTDTAGNTATKTVIVNVVNPQNPYLICGQITVLVLLIALICFVARFRKSLNKEKRLAKFSIDPVEDDDVSILDRFSSLVLKFIKKESLVLKKSVTVNKYAKFFSKYTVLYDDIDSIDLVVIKFILGILFIIVAIIIFILKLELLSIYEWIIPFTLGVIIVDIYNIINYNIYRTKIENDLLRAIIIMNNAFKSGRSIRQATLLVKEELDGPISKEFTKINLELSYGLDLNTVFKRFADRVNVEEASYLTASLTILNKTGGNIVKVFDSIEKSLYSKKKLRLELNSLTSSSKIIKNVLTVVPIIFFVLINFIDNSYFLPLFKTEIGICIFVIILVLYITYIYIINKVMKVRM